MAKRLTVLENALNTMLTPTTRKPKAIKDAVAALPTATDPLAIPDFLKRTGQRMTKEEIKKLCGSLDGSKRVWAPIRTAAEIAALPKPVKPIFVTNANAPVTVVVPMKGELKPRILSTYTDMEEFQASHDFKSYPVKSEESNNSLTVITCRAAIFADIRHNDTVPPVAHKKVQRAAKTENIANRIIEMFPADGGSRKEIQTILENDGMDKTMLDNSLGGRLDRLVREGKLSKAKEDKRVMYRLVGVTPVAAVPEVVVAVVKTTAGKATAKGKTAAKTKKK